MTFRRFIRQRDMRVARDTALFGSADYGEGIFAPGDSGLMGRPADALPTDAPLVARVSLGDPQAFTSIQRGSAVLPVFVTGSILGESRSIQRVAVAVNDRIAAVTDLFGRDDGRSFESIVDPRALTAGRNDVRIFGLREDGVTRTLVPIGRGESETYRLARRGQREMILSSSGERTPVVPGRTAGFLDRVEREGSAVRVSGWSASRELGAASRVFVFADEHFLVTGAPSLPRQDVAQDLGPAGRKAGFSVSASLRRSGPRLELRAFGVIDGRAYELRTTEGG